MGDNRCQKKRSSTSSHCAPSENHSRHLMLVVVFAAICVACTANFDEADAGVFNRDTPYLDQDTDPNHASDPSSLKPVELVGTLRDFTDDHLDFETTSGAEDGIVQGLIGDDDKPQYGGGEGTQTTHGRELFDQWFRDVEGVNQSTELKIVLTPNEDGIYTYNNQEFFPADDQLLGNQGRGHNYHFTFELHTEFTYRGGELFTFTGDDDLWVFINGRLAIDIGGIHGRLTETADLDGLREELGIEPGNTYALDLFFAERHTVMSTFRIDTTINDLRPAGVM